MSKGVNTADGSQPAVLASGVAFSESGLVSVSGGGGGINTNQPTDVAICPNVMLPKGTPVLIKLDCIFAPGAGTTSVTITLGVHNPDGSGGGDFTAISVTVLAGEIGGTKCVSYRYRHVTQQDWMPGSFRVALTQNGATANGTVDNVGMSISWQTL